MKHKLRRATAADVPNIIHLANSAFGCDVQRLTGRTLPALMKFECNEVWVAVCKIRYCNCLLGFIVIETDGKPPMVSWIAVAKRLKRQGIGSALMTKVPTRACAWIAEQNTASRAFFTKHGFTGEPYKPIPHWMYWERANAARKR